MIFLDTNALIRIAYPDASLLPLYRALQEGEEAGASAVAWFEFLCGPLSDPQLHLARQVVGPNVVPLSEAAAERGAMLFNATGRRRVHSADCMIAAAAMLESDTLFTLNLADFERFEPFGLKLLRE